MSSLKLFSIGIVVVSSLFYAALQTAQSEAMTTIPFSYFNRNSSPGKLILETQGLPRTFEELGNLLNFDASFDSKDGTLNSQISLLPVEPTNPFSESEMRTIWEIVSGKDNPSINGEKVSFRLFEGKSSKEKKIKEAIKIAYPNWPKRISSWLADAWKSDEKWQRIGLSSLINYSYLLLLYPNEDAVDLASLAYNWVDNQSEIWMDANKPQPIQKLMAAAYEKKEGSLELKEFYWSGNVPIQSATQLVEARWNEISPSNYEKEKLDLSEELSAADLSDQVSGFIRLQTNSISCIFPVSGRTRNNKTLVSVEPAFYLNSSLEPSKDAKALGLALQDISSDLKGTGEFYELELSNGKSAVLFLDAKLPENCAPNESSLKNLKTEYLRSSFGTFLFILPLLKVEGVGSMGHALAIAQFRRGFDLFIPCDRPEESYYSIFKAESSNDYVGVPSFIYEEDGRWNWNAPSYQVLHIGEKSSFVEWYFGRDAQRWGTENFSEFLSWSPENSLSLERLTEVSVD